MERRLITVEESQLLNKLRNRWRKGEGEPLNPLLKLPVTEEVRVAYVVDEKEKFTICHVFLTSSFTGEVLMLSGASKRMTYEPNADAYKKETGHNIAFSNAVRSQTMIVIS